MSQGDPLAQIRDAFSVLGTDKDETTTLYVPRPAIQTGGEKWRIFQKNLLSALDERAPRAGKTREAVEALRNEDFRGLGIVFFESPGGFRTLQLTRRPLAMLLVNAQPFALPALADLLDQRTAWAVALDKEEARLYQYSDGSLSDETYRMDAPDYEEIEHRRYVHDDILFHSADKGSTGGHHGPSIYHALGTGTDEEREKTDDAYYREVIGSLKKAVPAQLRRLHVFGDPRTVGRFAELFKSDRIELEQHQGAGDALSPDVIEEKIAAVIPASEEIGQTISDRDEITKAARRGQVDTLYVSLAHSLLEERSGDLSEHLSIRSEDDVIDARALNETITSAVMNGANLIWLPRSTEETIKASLRWDGEENAA